MMLKTQFSSKVDLTRFGNELFNCRRSNYRRSNCRWNTSTKLLSPMGSICHRSNCPKNGAVVAGAIIAGAFGVGAIIAGAFIVGAIIAGAIVVGVNVAGVIVAGVNFVGAFVAEQLSPSAEQLSQEQLSPEHMSDIHSIFFHQKFPCPSFFILLSMLIFLIIILLFFIHSCKYQYCYHHLNTINTVNFAGLIFRIWQHKNIRWFFNCHFCTNVHTKYRKYFRRFFNSRLLNFAQNSRKLMHREYYHVYSILFYHLDTRLFSLDLPQPPNLFIFLLSELLF